jgi:putative transposase
LKSAVAALLIGASWKRFRVHFMRNALSLVPKAAQQMVGATIRAVFAQPDAKSANQQWLSVSVGFRHRFARLSAETAVALREKPLAQVAPHKSRP